MSPEGGRGFNCWFPMPFARGARFEVENQGAHGRLFFFYIDYEEHAAIDPDLGRFHAWWNRTDPTAGTAREHGYTRADYGYSEARPSGYGLAVQGPWKQPNLTGARNYVILDAAGNGQYVGCNLNVDVFERQVNDWYGEGDDMIFIDGEPWPPRLHGTGTEDYFNTAFCPKQEYSAPYHGITVYSGNGGVAVGRQELDVPLPRRGSDPLRALDQGDDRDRPRQRPRQRLLEHGVLVSARTPRALAGAAASGGASAAPRSARARAGALRSRRAPHSGRSSGGFVTERRTRRRPSA